MTIHKILPRISVGDVPFSSNIAFLKALGYEEDIAGFDQIVKWHVYTKNDGLDCYVKDGMVVCLACFAQCYLSDRNLIGKTPEELALVLGIPDEIGDSVWVSEKTQQTPYEYFSYGLQVWIESGRVMSVFCNATY